MAKNPDKIEATKRLMGALARMKPKPHEEMKIRTEKKQKATTREARRRPLLAKNRL
jgi:hypothetical protein